MLIAHLAEKSKMTKKMSAEVLQLLIDGIVATVKWGDEVRIQGFWTFRANERAARNGVNPKDPSQKIKIPAMRVVSFKAWSDFKKAVKASRLKAHK